jgi:hypothetical protein
MSHVSTDVRRCEIADDGSSPCTGGNLTANASAHSLCQESHGGPLCEVCVSANAHRQLGMYFDRAAARCVDCDAERAMYLVMGVLISVVLLVLTSFAAKRCSCSRRRASRIAQECNLCHTASQRGLYPKLRVCAEPRLKPPRCAITLPSLGTPGDSLVFSSHDRTGRRVRFEASGY